ncbi:hypothetical protein [Acinetobacter soli]|uniref:hypothetical protein n=1 Tax=Acinetobacter soli TaxID=487316 RepID=UPI000A9A19C5|nr:hypothetical protein [Acinetobacter soli]
MYSTSTNHSDWSSHPARRNDHSFSTRGRFNRLSYLGWYGFFNLLPIALLLLLHFGLGVIRLDFGTLYDHGFALWLDGSGGCCSLARCYLSIFICSLSFDAYTTPIILAGGACCFYCP